MWKREGFQSALLIRKRMLETPGRSFQEESKFMFIATESMNLDFGTQLN